MLSGVVLNSNASLNDFREIGSLDFIPGSAIRLVIRLTQPQLEGLRYVAASGATLDISIAKSDNTDETVAMAELDAGDRSLWYADLTATQTENMIGGSFSFTLTEGATVQLGVIENGLSKSVIGGC